MNWGPGSLKLFTEQCVQGLAEQGVGRGQESHDLSVHKANFPDDLGFSSLTNGENKKFSRAGLEYFQPLSTHTCAHRDTLSTWVSVMNIITFVINTFRYSKLLSNCK